MRAKDAEQHQLPSKLHLQRRLGLILSKQSMPMRLKHPILAGIVEEMSKLPEIHRKWLHKRLELLEFAKSRLLISEMRL
jgi:hypothetical protein